MKNLFSIQEDYFEQQLILPKEKKFFPGQNFTLGKGSKKKKN